MEIHIKMKTQEDEKKQNKYRGYIGKIKGTYMGNPILDTRISFVRPSSSVTLVLPPLKSETG